MTTDEKIAQGRADTALLDWLDEDLRGEHGEPLLALWFKWRLRRNARNWLESKLPVRDAIKRAMEAPPAGTP